MTRLLLDQGVASDAALEAWALVSVTERTLRIHPLPVNKA